MKWTPKRVIALSALGLIAWGASSAVGDERGTAPAPPVSAGSPAATNAPSARATDPAAEVTTPPTETAAPLSTPAGPTEVSGTPEATETTGPGDGSAGPVSGGTAASALAALPVKGRAPMTGYSREQFGQAWSDDVNVAFGHNGCDTRNDILRRDLHGTTLKPGTNGCVVLTGSLTEPYSGQNVTFARGSSTSSLVQIDHVVALADAWQSGAQEWTGDTRQEYANDPLVLMAADGHLNQQKGASNAASWLPPNKSFRCTYVARQVAIKTKYHLWVTAPERDAIARVLATCPSQALPTDASASAAVKVARSPQPAPSRRPAPAPAPAPAAPAPAADMPELTDVYYKNCAAVRAAGAAPIHTGDPGYSRKLDRDGDGIACE